MPNTTLKRKRNTAPSPAFSIASSNTSNSSISEISKKFLDDSTMLPLDPDLKTMRKEVSGFKPYKVKKMYAVFRNNKSKKGGKKYKRKTMKKKKSRRPAMK